ncbi:DHA2 family efflux MFS transporter permease subunit [Streptomyces sp. N2-109]|uniref:DHA2 family efflux MFS transporter permease subunit n=1 Tax=Streptomyces gossypii TaxID=2883101 RepID=A0ABT2JQP0_9ACTN|nr:DHA2 family efflux MFS transporter permease subunit [Streptomyces gossypii]MCT2589584.1 DHA2 family efflux MFS transporter permease subunit [Streptomyces gossypii]
MYQRRWQILGVLCLSLVVVGMDNLIIILALPTIQAELSASGSELAWTVDAYALAFGGLLLSAGGLADRFGRNRILSVGLGTFLVFSVAAAYASNVELLILFRALMGVGGALIMPATLSIIKHVFPADEQGKAIGIWAGAASLGIPLGPVVGGALLEQFWWGSIFLINVPLVLLALIVGRLMIPESRDENHPGLDYVGGLLSIAGLSVLVYGLIEAPREGWSSPLTLSLLTGGVLLIVLFGLWERRAPNAMLTGSLFRDPRFGGAAAALSALAFVLFGVLFTVTQYFQFALGQEPFEAGTRLLAYAAVLLSAPAAPQLVEKLGLKGNVTFGMALIAVSTFLVATADTTQEALVVTGLAILGFALGFAMAPSATAIMAAAPAHQAGAGSASADAAIQIGGSLGIAVMGSVLTTSYRDSMGDLEQFPAPVAEGAKDSIGAANGIAEGLGERGDALAATANDAFIDGMSNALLVGTGVAAAGALVALFFLPGLKRTRELLAEDAAAGTAAGLSADPVQKGSVQ